MTEDGNDQPPDEEQIQHTHISAGPCCYAQGCNGGRCQCKECLASPIELPFARKRKVDGRASDKKNAPSTVNVLQLLKQRETQAEPLSVCHLAGLSQGRLSSNTHSISRYQISIPGFFQMFGVLPDGRIVTPWGSSGTLTVWAPQALLPQGYTDAQINAAQGALDNPDFMHVLPVYEVTSFTFFTDTDKSLPPEPVSHNRFVPLSGHRGEVYGVIIKRDGRIVTWSEDRSIRIWTECNGRWTAEIIGQNISSYCRIRELDDGRLLCLSEPEYCTKIFTEHEYGWQVNTLPLFINVLRDGRLYQLVTRGIQIWHPGNDDAVPYLLPHTSPVVMLSTPFSGGRIITATLEENSPQHGCFRLWTEQQDGTWTPAILGQDYLKSIIYINDRRVLLWGKGALNTVAEINSMWTPWSHINRFIKWFELLTADRLTSEDCAVLFWYEPGNEWISRGFVDENGVPVKFNHLLKLRDGRWIAWTPSGEIRVWTHLASGSYRSSVILLKQSSHTIYWVIELPGGWLAATLSDDRKSTSFLWVWNLFPGRAHPQD